jgi:hypothetical protein
MAQGSKKNKNAAQAPEEEPQWLKMPPPHLVSTNHRLLTNLNVAQLQQLYKPSAFEVDAPVYIFNGKHGHGDDALSHGSRGPAAVLDDEKLVKIVLSLMEETVWRQKFQAGLDVKEKRRQMMEETFAKRTAQYGSHVGLSDEDALSGSSQDGLSHMMKHGATSSHPIVDPYDLDPRDPQVQQLMLLEQAGGGFNPPMGLNWHPKQYQAGPADLSHLSLRAASEVSNRVAGGDQSLGNRNTAILVNRGKLDRA